MHLLVGINGKKIVKGTTDKERAKQLLAADFTYQLTTPDETMLFRSRNKPPLFSFPHKNPKTHRSKIPVCHNNRRQTTLQKPQITPSSLNVSGETLLNSFAGKINTGRRSLNIEASAFS